MPQDDLDAMLAKIRQGKPKQGTDALDGMLERIRKTPTAAQEPTQKSARANDYASQALGGIASLVRAIPGAEALQAGGRALVRRQPYREARDDLRGAEESASPWVRHGNALIGATVAGAAMPKVPGIAAGGPVRQGAQFGSLTGLAQSDPDVGLKERLHAAALGGGVGALGGAIIPAGAAGLRNAATVRDLALVAVPGLSGGARRRLGSKALDVAAQLADRIAARRAGSSGSIVPPSPPPPQASPSQAVPTATAASTTREVAEALKARKSPYIRSGTPPKRPPATPAGTHEGTGLPLNEDGTVTLYHHTSADAAKKITKERALRSAGEPDVYLTTETQPNTGYGDTVVPVRVRPEVLQLDDAFPGGRQDFRIPNGTKIDAGSRPPYDLYNAEAKAADAAIELELSAKPSVVEAVRKPRKQQGATVHELNGRAQQLGGSQSLEDRLAQSSQLQQFMKSQGKSAEEIKEMETMLRRPENGLFRSQFADMLRQWSGT